VENSRKPVVEFRDFSFQYFSQSEPTLHDINLTIYEGEKVLIVGPSGSGKSTLGNCINGLIPFSYPGEIKGSLTVCGLETKKASIFALSQHVGTVLQDPDGQFIGLSVGEDIAFALENECVKQGEMHETVRKTAAMVNMDGLLGASPFELSGGQKQRVSFAGVMVHEVEALLFDEPLANLDPATGKTAIELIDQISQDYHKTVVIIEHRLEDVLHRHVDRVIVMAEGRIVADLSPDALMAADILKNLGIREPLYVTALKYAGVPVTEELHAGRIDTLDVDAVKHAIAAWDAAQPERQKKPIGDPILQAKDLSYRYVEKRPILRNMSFSIESGEMVSLVGTNGAGKSTLAKVITGICKDPDGSLLFRGEAMDNWTIHERSGKIGYVMQNPNQMICKSMIYDEVALGLKLRGLSEEEIKPRVDLALKICGLSPFRKWPISALSFGQKKRVTIASVLVLEPELIILDEPTAGQDYRHYTEIMEFLRTLNESGTTILLITHDMHLMLEYTPHAIVLHAGEILHDGTAVRALTSEQIASKASLKVTSLYELATRAGIEDCEAFVQHFIDYERSTAR
jgi:energy-coupling factor transport system ATP-binding protein